MIRHRLVVLAAFACAALFASPLTCQCQLTWTQQTSPGLAVALVDDSSVWTPSGGASPKLLLAGSFVSSSFAILNGVQVVDLATGLSGPLGTGLFYEVDDIDVAANGDIVAGSVSGVPGALTGPVDVWDGTAWTHLPQANGIIYSVVWLPNGDIVAGGNFSLIGGVAANNIARWNGTAWQPLGAGVTGTVRSMVVTPNGTVVVGTFAGPGTGVDANGIALWDPAAGWTAIGLGATGQSAQVGTVHLLPNGDILGAGTFVLPTWSGNTVARWDGSDWTEVGGGIHGIVLAFTELPNGDLCAGGFFSSAAGMPANNIARLVNNSWEAIGAGLGSSPNHQVFTLTTAPNDDVYAAGFFASSPTTTNASLSILSTNCSATTTTLGSGSTGSGGLNVLTPDNQPYVGATFQATGTGLGSPALVLEVTGLAQVAIPLDSILPQAVAGTELYVQPIVTNLLAGLGSSAQMQIQLPNIPALAGAQLFTQMVVFELNPSGVIGSITATNGLQLTVGVF